MIEWYESSTVYGNDMEKHGPGVCVLEEWFCGRSSNFVLMRKKRCGCVSLCVCLCI